MCGIVGVARFGELGDENLRASALYLATSLLEITETRGTDATGLSALFSDGNFFGQKMGVSATEFIARYGGKADDFDGFLTVLRKYEVPLKMLIGHCRKKSAGSLNNVDNHPIKVGNIIGVHNGTLKNHDLIFDNLKCDRNGEVDSEAIFRLMKHYTKDCKEPFTVESVEEVCRRLEGTFSILSFNTNNPNQLVSARDGRPAEYCLIKPLKLVLIASEKKFFKSIIWNYNKLSWLHNVDGFIKLKESDVEFEVLPDDTLAIFDLTKEIDNKTKLKDLYETKRIPRTHDRIWKVPTKTTTYNANNYGQTFNSKDNKIYNKSARSNTTHDTELETDKSSNNDKKLDTQEQAATHGVSLGRVWNGSLKKHVKTFGKIEEVQNLLILKPEKKLKLSLAEAITENELDGSIPTTKVEENKKTTVCALTEEAASTENFHTGVNTSFRVIQPVEDEKKSPSHALLEPSVKKKDLLEGMKIGVAKGLLVSREHSIAIKMATENVINRPQFSTMHEIAGIMGTEIENIRQLPTTAFANRLVLSMFTDTFVAGWEAKCAYQQTDLKSLIKSPEERLSKAQRHIRVLKNISKYLGQIINVSTIDGGAATNYIQDWKEPLERDEINATALTEIFNAGDFRANKTLKFLMEAMQNK